MNDWAAIAKKLNVGRSMVFQLWGSGVLGSVTIGRRRFSTDNQIAQFICNLERGTDAAVERSLDGASDQRIDPELAGVAID